jgi:predicted membrane-bound dolichyl-phosphate-mannose-protein mannosyltransferase
MFNSEGERIDYVGNWIDETTLELEWHGTFEDQEQQKRIRTKWVTKDQFELHEINYYLGRPILETNYIFKRKETTP